MDFLFSIDLTKDLKKIKNKQPPLFKKITKQLKIFKINSKHPSLRTHKLKGNLSETWSITIEGNIRMIYTVKEGKALFFKIGNHGEVYKK